jgi:hypothetical protein
MERPKVRPLSSSISKPGMLNGCAVALDLLVVDVVVAEAAEIEREHLLAVADREAGGAPQPDGRVAPRQAQPKSNPPCANGVVLELAWFAPEIAYHL